MNRFLFLLVVLSLSTLALLAQPSAPIVVQAANQAAPAPAVVAPAPNNQAQQATLKTLQEIKAANEAQLAKQSATLEQLEELEKAVEQLKIYTKRG